MALPPDLDLNGYVFSHASVDARLFGMRTKGLKELNYKTSVERGEATGTAREVMGFTIGKVRYEASATILRAYWEAYKEECRARGIAPLDRTGLISVTATEPGKASKKVEIRVSGIKEVDHTSTDSPDPHEQKLSFDVLVILEDGKPLVSRSLYSAGAV